MLLLPWWWEGAEVNSPWPKLRESGQFWGCFLVLLILRLLQGLVPQSWSIPRAADAQNPLGKWHSGDFPLWFVLSGWGRKGGTTPRAEQTVGEKNPRTGSRWIQGWNSPCQGREIPWPPDFPAWGKSCQLGMSSAFPEITRGFFPQRKPLKLPCRAVEFNSGNS